MSEDTLIEGASVDVLAVGRVEVWSAVAVSTGAEVSLVVAVTTSDDAGVASSVAEALITGAIIDPETEAGTSVAEEVGTTGADEADSVATGI